MSTESPTLSIFAPSIVPEKMDMDPARWPGGPLICPVENLPALPDAKALSRFLDQNCPSVHIEHRGKCKACGYWHAR